jgi:hypothetical protein
MSDEETRWNLIRTATEVLKDRYFIRKDATYHVPYGFDGQTQSCTRSKRRKTRSQMTKEKGIAWAATIASLVIAAAPGITLFATTGRLGDYDASNAVLTATLIALVWTTYHTVVGIRQSAKQADEQYQAGISEAAALMSSVAVELSALEQALLFIEQKIYLADLSILDHPQIDYALTRPGILPKGTIGNLAVLDGTLRTMRASLALFGADIRSAYNTSISELTRYARNYTSVVSSDDIRVLIQQAGKEIHAVRRAMSQDDAELIGHFEELRTLTGPSEQQKLE